MIRFVSYNINMNTKRIYKQKGWTSVAKEKSFKARVKLIKARKEKGFTQETFAKELKISTIAYSLYEQGKRMPRPNIARQICEKLEKSTDILY